MAHKTLRHLLVAALCIGCIYLASQTVQATEYTEITNEPTYSTEYLQLNAPYLLMEDFDVDKKRDYSMKKGKSKITWSESYYASDDENITISYDVELATKPDFSDAQTFQVVEPSITLKKKNFGKNGGIFYLRVRGNYNNIHFSDWSEARELVYVKINKTNFPGLYDLLKKGGRNTTYDEKTGEYGVETIVYDRNKDNWLDPSEIEFMWGLLTLDESSYKDGKWYKKEPIKVSSLKGVEFLKGISTLRLAHFSGTEIDLSTNPRMYTIDVRGITSSKITVISPTVKSIYVEPAHSTKNFTAINLSECPNAVQISAYGNEGTPNLTLPKAKTTLKELSVSELGMKTLDLNAYKKLQLLYIYNSDITSLKINKCTDLRYLYFYYCNAIKSLDLSSNKKLAGLSVYKSPGLTTKSIKNYKNAKKATINTQNAKWWYGTDEYNKLAESLWK